MELGDFEQAKEHFIRVLEIKAPEDLRGLESHVLRALPERVTFLRGRLQGHHLNMPLAFSESRHLCLGLLPLGGACSMLMQTNPLIGKLGHLLQVWVQRLCVWQDARPHSVWLIGKS